VTIKEAIIVIGAENGIRVRELAEALGVDAAGVSKRREAARRKAGADEMRKLLKGDEIRYRLRQQISIFPA